MLKIIPVLEEARVLDRKEKERKVKGEKRRVTRKDCKRLKGLRNIAKKRMFEDRGALSKEEGDLIREYCTKKTFSAAGQEMAPKTKQKKEMK